MADTQNTVPENNKESISDFSDRLVVVKFADNVVPEFKEVNSKEWILYGKDNLFPEQLLYLYDKSSNHGAIINGKATYVFGKGLQTTGPINRYGETLNTVLQKCVLDFEIFNGFYLQVVYDRLGRGSWTHMPFQNIRKAKTGTGFYHAENWNPRKGKVEPVFIAGFNPKKKIGAQLFHYYAYRPGAGKYPLPNYLSAMNDIETDVEISIYNLSTIKNGMFPSKWITFKKGDPGPEGIRKMEQAIQKKFQGSRNAGNFFLYFATNKEENPEVSDLSATDLDKLFDQLNKTTQAEIFSGHQVTSPTLFGIMEAGKLGGRNEMQDAYEIFKNTYVNGRQQCIESAIEFLSPYMGIEPEQKLIPVEPLGTILSPESFKEYLPKQWVYEKLGINPDDYDDIPSLNVSGEASLGADVNDNLKNLTGRQTQNIERIIRKYKTGRITKAMAETLLKGGLGLTDSQVTTFLDFADIEKSEETEEIVAEMFSEVGSSKAGYTIVKSKPVKSTIAFTEEERLAFEDIKGVDASIINLIQKDKRITAQVIAETLKTEVSYIEERIKALQDSKIIKTSTKTIGSDTITEHTVDQSKIDTMEKPETVDMRILYSYEAKPNVGPAIISTTRPFCKKLIELDKLYTRAEIESISQRVGYSVWDRKGGFWGDKDECRHRWVSNVVLKKKKA